MINTFNVNISVDKKMTKHRLSKLQQTILEELANYRKSKTASPEELSLRVAKRYAPQKVWRLEEQKGKAHYYLARALHRKSELVRNVFSASFSRSLRNLEEKGLVQLIRGKYKLDWENGKVGVIRILTPQPRVTFVIHHESKYFGNECADAQWIIDLVNELRLKWTQRDVNNKRIRKKRLGLNRQGEKQP